MDLESPKSQIFTTLLSANRTFLAAKSPWRILRGREKNAKFKTVTKPVTQRASAVRFETYFFTGQVFHSAGDLERPVNQVVGGERFDGDIRVVPAVVGPPHGFALVAVSGVLCAGFRGADLVGGRDVLVVRSVGGKFSRYSTTSIIIIYYN